MTPRAIVRIVRRPRACRRGPRAACCGAALALLAALAAPRAAAGQSAGQGATSVRAADWPARLSSGTRAELAAILDSARAAGAPAGPLYDKAAEGVLKRADEPWIVVVVRRLAADLVTAREALGVGAPESEVALGASALRAGVSREALRQVARARAGGRAGAADASLIVPITALTELVAGGVPVDVAARAVAGFVARGGPASELQALLGPPAAEPQGGAVRARALLDALDGHTGTRRPPTP